MQDEHVLKFEDVLKLEGLGWIEHYSFKIPKTTYKIQRIQPSIEVNGLNMVQYTTFIVLIQIIIGLILYYYILFSK